MQQLTHTSAILCYQKRVVFNQKQQILEAEPIICKFITGKTITHTLAHMAKYTNNRKMFVLMETGKNNNAKAAFT